MSEEERLYSAFSEKLWPVAEAIMTNNVEVTIAVEELLGFIDSDGSASKAFARIESARLLLEGPTIDQLASMRLGDLLLGAWAAGWRPTGWNEN